jgi:hypothetical protein
MKRLENYKAKLKAAYAEETIRMREYNTAMRALKKIINQVLILENKVENETVKLAQAASRTKPVNRG